MTSVLEIAQKARAAALELATTSTEKKNEALLRLAKLLTENAAAILAANARDLQKASQAGLSKPMLERLALDGNKIAGISAGVEQVASLEDPVGEIIESKIRPTV